MTLIYLRQNRGVTRKIVIQDINGDAITPGTYDKIRAAIGREDETAKFSVSSDTPTVNGSTFTKGATNVLRIDASDLTFSPGVYTMAIDFYDNSDGQEWKLVDQQVVCLEGM